MSLSDILFNPKKAKRHPFEIIFVSLFYAILSLVSLWLIPKHASLTTIFLTIISTMYIVQGALILEEKEGKNIPENILLKRHSKTIFLFLYIFLGFMLAFILATLFLPEEISQTIFDLQINELQKLSTLTANVVNPGIFKTVFFNNFKVLTVSIVLALLYGAGALLILVWNASMIGYVIGSLVRYEFGFHTLPIVTLKYLLHGIPEMLAYFIGALIGGIVFVAIVRGDMNRERIKKTSKDILILYIVAIGILIIAGFIETYISALI